MVMAANNRLRCLRVLGAIVSSMPERRCKRKNDGRIRANLPRDGVTVATQVAVALVVRHDDDYAPSRIHQSFQTTAQVIAGQRPEPPR